MSYRFKEFLRIVIERLLGPGDSIAAALKTIRRHRVLELYLTRHLGFDWDTVHAEAERCVQALLQANEFVFID